jgi:hypothetical protein
MARTQRHTDDDPLDENGLLRDGARVRVSLFDATSVRNHRPLLHDGRGGTPGRRPGFVFSRDAAGRGALEKAYSDYETHLCDAWKTKTHDAEEYAPGSEGCACTVSGDLYPDDFGSEGTVCEIDGVMVCVPNDKVSADDRAATRDRQYQIYDSELQNQWRKPPR